ncbi:hypothetical protein HGRIS_014634 [Hohenbuehelia grisea]|uniref:Uncharacterized protein n=1 Tax=Hohenbuehelia grisea TaxID=104357 RepID=A0ABR3JWA1_9AGAR
MPAGRRTSASEHDEIRALPSPALVTASILTKGSSRYQDDEAAAARYAYNAGMLLDEHLDPPQCVLLMPRPSRSLRVAHLLRVRTDCQCVLLVPISLLPSGHRDPHPHRFVPILHCLSRRRRPPIVTSLKNRCHKLITTRYHDGDGDTKLKWTSSLGAGQVWELESLHCVSAHSMMRLDSDT